MSNVDSLIDFCQRGYLLVTPNKRLVHHVKQYLAGQLRLHFPDKAVHTLPRILSFEELVQDVAMQQSLEGRLPLCRELHGAAEIWLWESIIRDDIEQAGNGNPLMAYSSLAREARQAYRLVLEYQLSLNAFSAELDAQEESRRLQHWIAEFTRRTEAASRRTSTQMQAALLEIESAPKVQEPGICAIGFQLMNPLQQKVLDTLSSGQLVQRDLSRVSQLQAGTDSQCYRFDSATDELQAAANWLQAKQSANPQGRFAVVVPQLAPLRPLVERLFTSAFAVDQAAVDYDVLNLSSGIPLSRTTMVRHWLLLLKSMAATLNRNDTLELIQSPYFFQGSLTVKRKLQEAVIATQLDDLGFDDWIRALNWHDPAFSSLSDDDVLLSSFEQLREQCRREQLRSKKQTLSQWLQQFSQWVSMPGWPMQDAHDSDEYQQYRMFQRSIQQLNDHSELFGVIPFSLAISLSERFFAQADYQPQTKRPTDREIPDVLGVLEAGGQIYDGLWLCQMGDREWPMSVSTNALLPYGRQLEHQMPGTPEREFVFWQGLVKQFAAGSTKFTVSYCATVDDVPQRLSGYLQDVIGGEQAASELSVTAEPSHSETNSLRVTLEAIEDVRGAELASPDSCLIQSDTNAQTIRIRNGLSMLRDYAVLPLQAYFKHRLAIESLPPVNNGLTGAERGMIVHAVLDSVWRTLKHQQTLNGMAESDLQELISESLLQQIEQLNRRRFKPLHPSDMSLEVEALTRILSGFLSLERERAGFSVVASELTVRYPYKNFELFGRIDRIDLCEDGGLQIIDYKTGRSNAKGWFDEAVSEPQLPLYALALSEPENNALLQQQCAELFGDAAFVEHESVASIAYASLSVGYVGLDGCSDTAHPSLAGYGVKPLEKANPACANWDEQLQTWREGIDDSFAAMLAGDGGMVVTAPAAASSYQPLLRSGYGYTIDVGEQVIEMSVGKGEVATDE